MDGTKHKLGDEAGHTVVWVIYNDERVASIDDVQMALAKADVPSMDRNHVELNNGGPWAEFKDVKVWKAEPDDKWPLKRPQIIASLKKKADKLGYRQSIPALVAGRGAGTVAGPRRQGALSAELPLFQRRLRWRRSAEPLGAAVLPRLFPVVL